VGAHASCATIEILFHANEWKDVVSIYHGEDGNRQSKAEHRNIKFASRTRDLARLLYIG